MHSAQTAVSRAKKKGFRGFQGPGSSSVPFQGVPKGSKAFQGSRRFQGSRVPGSVPELQGFRFQNSRVRVPGFRSFRVPGFQGSRVFFFLLAGLLSVRYAPVSEGTKACKKQKLNWETRPNQAKIPGFQSPTFQGVPGGFRVLGGSRVPAGSSRVPGFGFQRSSHSILGRQLKTHSNGFAYTPNKLCPQISDLDFLGCIASYLVQNVTKQQTRMTQKPFCEILHFSLLPSVACRVWNGVECRVWSVK